MIEPTADMSRNEPDTDVRQMSMAQPCPIIPDGRQRRLEYIPITSLVQRFDSAAAAKAAMMLRGYRKDFLVYSRDACSDCAACKPSRIALDRFALSKSQTQLFQRNADLTVSIVDRYDPGEHYRLFIAHAYHRGLDLDADLLDPDHLITGLMGAGPLKCSLMEVRDRENRLLGASMFDVAGDGIFAGHSYYNVAESRRRSLGSFLLLKLADHARTTGKAYLYLGPWTEEPSKYTYKSRFKPLELMVGDGVWMPHNPPAKDPAP